MEAVSSISNNNYNCYNRGIICQPLRPRQTPLKNAKSSSASTAFVAQNFGNRNIEYQNTVSKKNELGIA